MNLIEKLDALKAKTNDNNLSLAKKAGIPPTTIYGIYDKGYKNMKLSTLQALCDYFGVSLDYLAKDNYTEDLPDPDEQLLSLFHDLNEEGQERLIEAADDMVRSGKYKKISSASRGSETGTGR